MWIEKILTQGEFLPEKWPVDGTVGYDFLNILSGLFVNQKNEQKLTKIYDRFIRKKLIYGKIYYERRKKYVQLQMGSDIHILAGLLSKTLKRCAKKDILRACVEIIACFPVYRTYIKPGIEVRKKDRDYMKIAIKRAKTKAPALAALFEHIQRILLSSHPNKPELHFLMHLQQLTAAAMAKGIEDSACYIYNRLISLNEVGNSSNEFGCSQEEFHAFNLKKLKLWPLGPLTSSTHDSKFSEDARLRLHMLSEIPEKWKSLVYAWRKENKKHFIRIKGRLIPEPNTEYYIYQILLALGPDDPNRLWNCLQKALREADSFTSWRKVDENYENAVKQFLFALVKNPNEQFLRLQKEIADLGHWNSLSALALKIGSCGIFDLYQGDELLNVSLMDPDNRRPVDFGKRKKELFHLQNLKMTMTAKGLRYRRSHKELFLKGDYIPLKTSRSVIAFARKWKEEELLVVAGRFFTEKQKKGTLLLPSALRGKTFQDLFTDKKFVVKKQRISLSEIFNPYPFTVLISKSGQNNPEINQQFY